MRESGPDLGAAAANLVDEDDDSTRLHGGSIQQRGLGSPVSGR